MLPIALVALAALPVLAPSAPRGPHEIGSHGATLDLDTGWRRKLINPDLGEDQFMRRQVRAEFGLAVMEFDQLLETQGDFEEFLSTFVSGVATGGRDAEFGRTQFRRSTLLGGNVGHASQVLEVELMGVDLVYDFHLVGRDGLSYMIMVWSTRQHRVDLRRLAKEAVGGFRFPPADSEWARAQVPVRRSTWVAGHEVDFEVQAPLFHSIAEADDSELALATRDYELSFYFIRHDSSGSADTAIDNALDILGDNWSPLVELSRVDRVVDGRDARLALARCENYDGELNFQILMVPLRPGVFLDLRMVYEGDVDARRVHRERLLDSLRVGESAASDAYPRSEPEPKWTRPLPSEVTLLGHAALRGRLAGGARHVSLAPDGSVLAPTPSGIQVLRTEATDGEFVLREDEWNYGRSAAFLGERLFQATLEGELSEVVGGVSRPLEGRARLVCSAGNAGLLLAREPEQAALTGFEWLGFDGESSLVLLASTGAERTIATFPHLNLTHLAVDAAGRHAVVATTARDDLGDHGFELVRVELADGAKQDLGTWMQVESFGAAPLGWLVNGRPAGEAAGIWWLRADGERELLASSTHFRGIALTGDELLFTSQRPLELDHAPEQQLVVYAAPIDRVREDGPGCAPWHAGSIQALAAETFAGRQIESDDPHLFDDFAVVETLVADARALAETRFGAALPSSPRELDELFVSVYGGAELGEEAHLFLVALLADCLVSEGARWVGGTEPALGRLRGATSFFEESWFAIGYLPAQVVAGTLDPDGEWWQPATSILAGARGRTVLLGTDPEALARAVEAEGTGDARQTVRSGSAEAIGELFAAHDTNGYLRAEAYRELARLGRLNAVVESAEVWVTDVADARSTDLRAWFAARVALEGTAAGRQRLVEELRGAVEAHPDESWAYLLLGETYAASHEEGSAARARACYEKVLEISSWGELADQARAGLDRL